ncbi:MAG: TolC family protein [Gammaproteobacteria bacterium]|nr:TolC family protein [Gammaproteobacteria bacterium]
MATYAKFLKLMSCLALLSHISANAEQALTIERAVQVALDRDTLINVYKFRRDAFKEQSIAENALPDPQLKIGLMNLPTDTFELNQEPMTQLQLGIQQMFPRGNTLEIKSQRAISMSMVEEAKLENYRRKVTREVRETWLELYYWLNAERVVKDSRNFFEKLVSVTQQQYAAGRQKQQDVIRSELELGMLDDREINIRTQLEMTRTKLEKYVGNSVSKINLDNALPDFMLVQINKFSSEEHPLITMQQAMVDVGEKNVELAKQSYKPSWMLDLTYGKREDAANGSTRADFVSAMVKFDLPIFTGNFQDKKLSASKYRLNSALNTKEDVSRDLKRKWDSALLKEVRFSQRAGKYKTLLIPKAKENTKAALFSYQSGRGAFTALMRAQIIELETKLKALRLEVEHKKTQAQLLYFTGENNEV